LLTELLNIPSPKDLMAGPEVNRYFWQGRIEEIKSYCEKDIEASANLMLRLSGMDLIDEAPF
jgi:predicted PolB exonuclease-like 3'-5' exonuclease